MRGEALRNCEEILGAVRRRMRPGKKVRTEHGQRKSDLICDSRDAGGRPCPLLGPLPNRVLRMRLDLGQRKRAGTKSPERQSAGEVDGKKDEAGTGLGTVSAGSRVPIASEGGASAEAEAGLPEAARRTLALDLRVPGTVPLPTTRMRLRTGRAPMRAPGPTMGADAEEPVQGDDGGGRRGCRRRRGKRGR